VTAAPGAGLSRARVFAPPPRRSWWERTPPVLRGVLAVLLLLALIADELVTAVLRLPPLAPHARRFAAELADEYRRGRAGAVDAHVIEDQDQEDATDGA
jgi:hypothetical protein